jgi:hypothetical protein
LTSRRLKSPSDVLAAMKKRHVARSLSAGEEWVFENEVSENVVYSGRAET